MKKDSNFITDPVVKAIDRASHAQYRLEALVAHVEEVIKQDREQIRASCPFEGNVGVMSKVLLHYLQREQTKVQGWANMTLGEELDAINVRKLAKFIWPELRRSSKDRE